MTSPDVPLEEPPHPAGKGGIALSSFLLYLRDLDREEWKDKENVNVSNR